MDGRGVKLSDLWVDGHMDRWMDGWDGWKVGMDEWVGGWVGGRMDQWNEGMDG